MRARFAELTGRKELFDLVNDPGEAANVADQHPDIVCDLEARLLAYAREHKPSEWIKTQLAVLGTRGRTVFDAGFDIDVAALPARTPRSRRR